MYQYLYAENWFAIEYEKHIVRAPRGSPYDFAYADGIVNPRQVEVKGVSCKTADGVGPLREGRAWIDLEAHARLGGLPNPWYVFAIYNGEIHPIWMDWRTVDGLINRYRCFTRAEPDGRTAVKIALHKIIEESKREPVRVLNKIAFEMAKSV